MEETDRTTLETGEARVLVSGFLQNGSCKDWLTKALKVSKRIYGAGSEDRIRAHMKTIWRSEFLL